MPAIILIPFFKLLIMHYFRFLFLASCAIALLFACKNGETDETPQSPKEEPLFELLPPEKTGIHFSNRITETFQNSILNNSYLYNGGGVAIIDVNNDGLPDLYFSATQEPNRLFLNKGNLQFEDITERAGVAAAEGTKTGVTVVDINADGFQDIYVCRSGMVPGPERANLLFINNGDLTFTESAAQYGVDDQSASNHANFFDYDLDGDLDLYILNHPVDFQNVNRIQVEDINGKIVRKMDPIEEWDSDRLLRNEGNGKFTDVTAQAGILNRAWGLSATVTDFNGDGYPDIFVGNDYIEPDYLYINNKNGTFSVQTERFFRHTSNHTMGVDIADLNNDGLVDIVALDMIAEDNQRQKELMTTMLLDRYNNLLRFGYGHQFMRNTLQLNTGAAPGRGDTFSEIGVLAGISNTDWSWSPLLADFDNDGLKDLFVTNGYRRDVSDLDYLTYTMDSVLKTGGLTAERFETVYDYLKLIPSTPLLNYMFKNVDGLNFKNLAADWGMAQPSFATGAAYADLDNDGDLDLVVNLVDDNVLFYNNLSIEKGRGNWLQVKLTGSPKNPEGTGARLRITYGDGQIQYQEMTPTRGFYSSTEHLFHFGLGDETQVSSLEIQWPPDGRIQVLNDLPVNRRLQLKYADAKPGKWQTPALPPALFHETRATGIEFRHREDDFIDFNRERLIPHKFSDRGPKIAVADVNGDGLEDFFIGAAGGQAGALFLQQANGRFQQSGQAVWQADAVYEDMGCVFFDADGDGDPDLYVVSGGSAYQANSPNYQDRLYLNDGNGNFTKAPEGVLPTMRASGSCASVFDFDKDGDLDIFVGGLVEPGSYPMAPQTYLLRNDGGNFTEVCAEVAPELQRIGMVNAMLWTDLDGDGAEELIVAGEWLPISVFKIEAGKLKNATAKFGFENTQGWWNCLKVADLDGDGDLDLVAGNLGLNTRLKASPKEPLRLVAKDFDDNGSLDPVLAYYNNGKLYPLPMRDLIIKQLPYLKKKFVYNRVYGNATLEEVFSKKEMEGAIQLEAKMFATVWFENRNGKFVAHPLPTQAQFAPCNQLLLEDFDGDGNTDILLVGNSYSPDVETGRYDAGNGLLLSNDGKGNFQPIPNRYTGFWATKAARDLAPIRLADGGALLLIANNNDEMQVVEVR